MEKTLARAIYKRMEIGKEYTTRNLVDLIGSDLYKYVGMVDYKTLENGKSVMQTVSDEMWKVVSAGFAETYTRNESLACIRNIKFGTTPKYFKTYIFRIWIRTK